MDDLMDRLAAADPYPDAQRLTPDEEREAEALLARVLTSPPEEARVARRRLLAVGATACAAALAFLAVDLLQSGGPGSGVIDRAVAALTRENSVYHVVQIKRGTGNVGDAEFPPFRVESWHASDGRMHEKVSEPGGRPLEEVAGTRPRDGSPGPLIRYDPSRNTAYGAGIARDRSGPRLPALDPAGDPGATLSQLEEEGLLRVDGQVDFKGRRADRLVSEPIERSPGEEERFEYLVDSETHLPLQQRYENRRGSETHGFVSEYLVYERLPLDARSEAELDLDRHRGMRCADGADELRGLGFPNPC